MSAVILFVNGNFVLIGGALSTISGDGFPVFTAQPVSSRAGRAVTVSTGVVSGEPAPSLSIALTLGGEAVTPTGTGPWTYEVPSSASAQTLAWIVTATNTSGNAQATGSLVIEADVAPPAFTVQPSGVLNGRTLTVSPGTATGQPAPTVTIAMTLDGEAISPSGSGPWTYEVPSSLDSQTVAWTVTASNDFGSVQASGSSVVVADLVVTPPVISGVPTISGTPEVGQTLTATPAPATGQSTTTWQWRRSGANISGATSATYLLVEADEGETISVLQTETNAQGVDVAESAPTATVAASGAAVDGIATPGPVLVVSASPTAVTGTLPADPAVVNRTINDRVVALVPLAAYTGNEQDPVAWTAGGAVYLAFQDAQDTFTFTGSFSGDYVLVWEARDTTTNPRTDSDWSTGTPVSVFVPGEAPEGVVTAGQQNSDGNVPLTLADVTEDAPDSFFVFTTSVTPPSVGQVILGQDHTGSAAAESGTFSFTESNPNPVVSGLSLTTGTYHLYVVLGDAGGDRSPVYYAGPVTVDFTAATLSGLAGTQTGATTATAAVTSNEAGGTIFFGVRPSAATALTAAQLVAGSGGVGVAWASDTSPTADGNNAASFTGLSAETAYRVDAVQRDGFGNLGTVVSSDEFTTASAPAASTAFIEAAVTPAFGTTHNIVLTETLAAGTYLIGALNFAGADAISSVSLEGEAATALGAGHQTGRTQRFYEVTITGGGNRTLQIVTASGTNFVLASVWRLGSKTYQSELVVDPPHAAGPITATGQISTVAGDEIFAIASHLPNPTVTATNMTLRTPGLGGITSNNRNLSAADNLSAAGGSPESFSMTFSDGFDDETVLFVRYG